MSTVQPTDKTLVNRAGVDHSAPADMSTVQDTDLLLINRAGVDYKCTFLDWKNSQSKAPDVGAVTLADVAGGSRFTSTAFPVSATMTENGIPASTKKLKAYVEGTLQSAAQTSAITQIDQNVLTVPGGTARVLQFQSSDSAYLSRTPASAGNRTVYTISFWLKRTKLAVDGLWVFRAGSDASNYTECYFGINDKLNFQNVVSGSVDTRFVTTQVFGDPSAWYHIVFSINGSTAAKLYINGAEVTNFDSTTGPGASNHQINNTVSHTIGRNAGSDYADFYLADYYLIDGQALDPTSFTEVSGTTGKLIPKAYTGTYGANGFHLDGKVPANLGKDAAGSNDWSNVGTKVTTIDTTTLTFADNTQLANFAAGEAVTEVGNGDDATGTVNSVDTTANTMQFATTAGTWDVGSAVKGPLKTQMVTTTPNSDVITNVATVTAPTYATGGAFGTGGAGALAGNLTPPAVGVAPTDRSYIGTSSGTPSGGTGTFTPTVVSASNIVLRATAYGASAAGTISFNAPGGTVHTVNIGTGWDWVDYDLGVKSMASLLVTITGNNSANLHIAGFYIDGLWHKNGATHTTLTFATTKDLAKFAAGDAVKQDNSSLVNIPLPSYQVKYSSSTNVTPVSWAGAGAIAEVVPSSTRPTVNLQAKHLLYHLVYPASNVNFVRYAGRVTTPGGFKLFGSSDGVVWVEVAKTVGVVAGPGDPDVLKSGTTPYSYFAAIQYGDAALGTPVDSTSINYGLDVSGTVSVPSPSGTVASTDTTAKTMTLATSSGTWGPVNAGHYVIGPTKTGPAANVKLYCKLDAAGAVSDLQSADPGFTAWTPAGTGPYTGTVTWPATLPSGNAPDADLPAGTTITVEVQATNTAGTDSAKSNVLTPA